MKSIGAFILKGKFDKKSLNYNLELTIGTQTLLADDYQCANGY